MNLFELNAAIRNAYQSFDPETGEITVDIDGLELQRTDKIEGIALSIKEDIALADAIEAEAKKMIERAKSVKNRAERWKRYLGDALTDVDEETNEVKREKFGTARVSIGWRRAEKVEIEDEPGFIAMHPDFCATKVEVKPDRQLIKKTIKDGGEVTGAALVETQSIQIK